MKPNDLLATALQPVILGSVTKQHSNGRIVVQMRMPLNGESMATLPDWVARGYEDVSKKYSVVDPEVQEMSDLAIGFSAEKKPGEMFAKRAMKVASASLKGFKVARVGKPDAPEVELQFKLYLSFARDFWAWAGEMAGEEVYMTFPSSAPAREPIAETAELPLESASGETEEDAPEPPGAAPARQSAAAKGNGPALVSGRKKAPPRGPAPKKSGPGDLAAEHQRQLNANTVQ